MVQAVVAFKEGFLRNEKDEEIKVKLEDLVERLREIGLGFTSRSKWVDDVQVVKTGAFDQEDHILVGSINAPDEDFTNLCENISRMVGPYLRYTETVYVKFKE